MGMGRIILLQLCNVVWCACVQVTDDLWRHNDSAPGHRNHVNSIQEVPTFFCVFPSTLHIWSICYFETAHLWAYVKLTVSWFLSSAFMLNTHGSYGLICIPYSSNSSRKMSWSIKISYVSVIKTYYVEGICESFLLRESTFLTCSVQFPAQANQSVGLASTTLADKMPATPQPTKTKVRRGGSKPLVAITIRADCI